MSNTNEGSVVTLTPLELSLEKDGEGWVDINTEAYREYTFPTGKVFISAPAKLLVKRKLGGDSHRIIDSEGRSHYIPTGWLSITWEAWSPETSTYTY